MPKPYLWIALDGLAAAEERTIDLAHQLHREVEGNYGFKINLDYVLRRGIGHAVQDLPERPVFADYKMWNGSRTMAQALLDCHSVGVSATNMYALAEDEFAKAVKMYREKAGPTAHMRIYALTVLTHYDDRYAIRRFSDTMETIVERLANVGMRAGADAVIMPRIERLGHLRFAKVHPGCRPGEFKKDGRHKYDYRPEEVAGLSDVEVVCGGPIMDNDDPPSALKAMLQALSK